MKVDFMIVGAQKSGTTSLYSILKEHAGISFCKQKEPNFWCGTKDWKKDIAVYHQLFEQKEKVLYAEASTSSTLLPYISLNNKSKQGFSADKLPYSLTNVGIWEDLFEYNSELKFIYIVRRPYERIISNYKHFYQRGYINAGLNQSIIEERCLIDFTRYYTQISPFLKKFGREKILILNFDDLKGNQQKIVNQVASFLNLDPSRFNVKEQVHANKATSFRRPYYLDKVPSVFHRFFPFLGKRKVKNMEKLSDDSKTIIRSMLQFEIEKIGELMGKDLNHWLV